jgi:autotransporter-associated beta strand protein
MMGRREKLLIGLAVSCAGGGGVVGRARGQTFSSGITTGTLQNGSIGEASGIVASRLNTNVLWTHNDSGNSAQLFAMTSAGASLGTYTLSGTSNVDWEDIATGPGPTAGTNYLYVGDIGDNLALRSSVSVYRVAEPTVSDTQSAVTTSVSGTAKLTLAYPNGPHDAESLFVDPLTKDLYIVSKRDAQKFVYRAAYPQATSGTTTMQLVATLNNSNWITAADISVDGSRIIMRAGATDTGLMYTRPAGGTVADAFGTTPVAIPLLAENQGEAIGFDPFGRGYYTTSESAAAPIHYFDRLPPPAVGMYWDSDGVAAGSRSSTGAGLGGTGTWNASAVKWYNGNCDVPWQNGHDAVFWGTAGTVTLGSAQTVNSLSFKTTGYTITASTLTLGGSAVTVDAGVVATIGSVVAGSVGLVKNGPGTLQLATANTYSGGTIVNGGVLGIVSSSLGAQPASPTVNLTINNGSTVRFDITGLTLAVNRSVVLGTGGGVIDTQGFTDAIAGTISGASLTKTGSGTLTLTSANTYTGGTTVSAGTLVAGHGDAFAGAAITVANGATARAQAGLARALTLTTLTTAGSGRLDLTNNAAVIRNMTAAAVRSALASGFAAGAWTGGGIASSTAAADASRVTAIGFGTAAALNLTTFKGVNGLAAGDVLLKYTYYGDNDLSGAATLDDFTLILAGYQNAGTTWAQGDYDYSGLVTLDDFTLFLKGYQQQGAPLGEIESLINGMPMSDAERAAMLAAAQAVPEPAGVMAFAIAAGVICLRRKRSLSACV